MTIESYLNSLPDDITELDVSERMLTYLPDISRFKSLEKLFCYKNSIVKLPELPKNLKELNCHCNKLTKLPELPKGLRLLRCYANNLTKLEIDELQHLIKLDCGYNKLSKLPNLYLHKELNQLLCAENGLTELPELPESLQLLRCESNNLVTLPPLPNNIEILYCDNNQLKNLPLLPRELIRLECSNNCLTELPPLPPKLSQLFCEYNELSALPLLNDGVYVSFYGNAILNLITNAEYQDDIESPDYDVYRTHQYTRKELQKIVKTIYHFKYSYYCLKFKRRFQDFLWQRVREPVAMKRYHPSELQKILDAADSEVNENELLDKW